MEKVPSPKDQKLLSGSGAEVLRKSTTCPRQTVSGAVKADWTELVGRLIDFMTVSTQPISLMVIKLTSYRPPLLYWEMSFSLVDVDPFPKSHL